MSPDSRISTPTAAHVENVLAAGPNAAAMDAVRAHHAELAEQLRARTDNVVTAARAGECTRERDALHDWYRTELMPHIVAEEQALYSPAAELDAIKLLIRGMLAEHQFLVSRIADLALASGPCHVATMAVAAQAVFTVHLSKENDLLLPALDRAGLNLPALLDGMHAILGHPHSLAEHGCGCGHDAGASQSVLTEVNTGTDDVDGEVDVRALAHGHRHEIIFARLDRLQPGSSLVIVNDHDPKPLRYQTSAMWPDRFEWTYRQAGPDVWRVAITRVG